MNLADEIAALARRTVPELRERYAALFGEATTAKHPSWPEVSPTAASCIARLVPSPKPSPARTATATCSSGSLARRHDDPFPKRPSQAPLRHLHAQIGRRGPRQ